MLQLQLINNYTLQYLIKLLLKKMIDGVYPSQFVQVQAMRTSHYRNLRHILTSTSTQRFSWLSPDFKQMSKHKKTNHSNRQIFNKNQQQQKLTKLNSGIYQRLKRISSQNSRYAIKTQPSTPKDRLLHHNYLYQCDRRYQKIQQNNKIIANKLTKAKGDISHQKLQTQFRINKCNVSRLQKFQRFKRLNRVVSKLMRDKFMNSTTTSRTLNNTSFKLRINPQNQ